MSDKTVYVEFSVRFSFISLTREEVFELQNKLINCARSIHPNPITDPIDVDVDIMEYAGGNLE